MHALKSLPHYTYSDYLLWEGKWEVIDGIPHAMSPAASPRHQYLAGNFHGEFRKAIQAANCTKCKVYQPIDYKISDDTVLQPDLMVVCRPIKKLFLDFAPVLIIEILSSSTKFKDKHTKYSIFENKGVKWYLLVDPDKELVEIYHLINKEYKLIKTIHDELFSFDLDLNCRAIVQFRDVW